MSANKEDILAWCIEDVKSGRAGIEDCMRQYPRLGDELEPLLKLAVAIEPPLEVSPSSAFKSKARSRLIAEMHIRQPVTKNLRVRYSLMNAPLFSQRRFKMAAIIIAIVLIVASTGGGTAYASQDALPGDILYPEKTFIESSRLFFASSDQTESETHLQIADNRIDELARLPADRSRFVERLMESYENHIQQGLNSAEKYIRQGGNASGLLNRFQERMVYHQGELNASCNRLQVEARHIVRVALNASGEGLENANRLMVSAHLENAVRHMAQVNEKARTGKIDEVSGLLHNYERELDLMITAANQTEDAVALLEGSRERLRIAFDQIPETIPEEASDAIENARLRTMHGLDKAIESSGSGKKLGKTWEEFKFEWGAFMNQSRGEVEPGSVEWQNAWQNFELEWEQFMYQWQGNTSGPAEWQYAWEEHNKGQHDSGKNSSPAQR